MASFGSCGLLYAIPPTPPEVQTAVDAQPETERIVQSNQSDLIRERVGTEMTVRGRVSGVNVGPSGVIHFINFAGNKRGDFVVIIRKGSIANLSGVFGAEFPFNLTNSEVEVSGVVSIYEETPQIEIKESSQLRRVE